MMPSNIASRQICLGQQSQIAHMIMMQDKQISKDTLLCVLEPSVGLGLESDT